jgi:hypothetical protein
MGKVLKATNRTCRERAAPYSSLCAASETVLANQMGGPTSEVPPTCTKASEIEIFNDQSERIGSVPVHPNMTTSEFWARVLIANVMLTLFASLMSLGINSGR